MTILVFGKNGQVGNELVKFKEVISLSRNEANYLNPNLCLNFVDQINPSLVINAVAKTNVDLCEKERSECDIINTYTPIKIAKKCKDSNIPFIQISTDYVFDGKKTIPYKEHDVTNPLNYYGLSKLNAEKEIINLDFNSVILRTSWVFSKLENNFVFKIINQLKNKKEIKVVYDQFGSPTSAEDIANICIKLSTFLKKKNKIKKIYHYSSYPLTNFYDFAKEIILYSGNDKNVKKIQTSELFNITKRPQYSYLNCDLILKDFGIKRPNWKESLKKIF